MLSSPLFDHLITICLPFCSVSLPCVELYLYWLVQSQLPLNTKHTFHVPVNLPKLYWQELKYTLISFSTVSPRTLHKILLITVLNPQNMCCQVEVVMERVSRLGVVDLGGWYRLTHGTVVVVSHNIQYPFYEAFFVCFRSLRKQCMGIIWGKQWQEEHE